MTYRIAISTPNGTLYPAAVNTDTHLTDDISAARSYRSRINAVIDAEKWQNTMLKLRVTSSSKIEEIVT